MSERQEPTTIGLSDQSHEILRQLKTEGYFREMQDAYRFAIAFAARTSPDIASVPDVRSPNTIFNIGTIDPDRRIRVLIESVLGVPEGQIYKTAEKLAEAGVIALGKKLESGTLNLSEVVTNLGASPAGGSV